MAIPRLLHQTVRRKDDIHPLLKENILSLRAGNAHWQYRLYDDHDIRRFIAQHYSANVLRYYEQINPVYGPAKADFFRYLLLYQLGGVYLDVKSTVNRPLDEIAAPGTFLLSRWNNQPGQRYQGWGLHTELGPEGEFQQWHIVSPPGHPFLKAAILQVMWNIDNYDPETHGHGKIGVLRVTGPIAYTLAIEPILRMHPHALIDAEQHGLVYSITGGPGQECSHELLFPQHYRNGRSGQPIVRRTAPGAAVARAMAR